MALPAESGHRVGFKQRKPRTHKLHPRTPSASAAARAARHLSKHRAQANPRGDDSKLRASAPTPAPAESPRQQHGQLTITRHSITTRRLAPLGCPLS